MESRIKTGPAANADESVHCNNASGKDMGSNRRD